jgi:hypothetical protein
MCPGKRESRVDVDGLAPPADSFVVTTGSITVERLFTLHVLTLARRALFGVAAFSLYFGLGGDARGDVLWAVSGSGLAVGVGGSADWLFRAPWRSPLKLPPRGVREASPWELLTARWEVGLVVLVGVGVLAIFVREVLLFFGATQLGSALVLLGLATQTAAHEHRSGTTVYAKHSWTRGATYYGEARSGRGQGPTAA